MEQNGDATQRTSFSTLGRYRIQKRIGRGGMADVWLCEDPRLHRLVAVKTLPAHSQHNQEFLFRFKQEAQAAAALHHPHILAIHDYGEQQLDAHTAIAYIVMPYITGGSLADRLDQNAAISPEQAILYLTQAAQAIDHAHGKGIIHRDIKPGNMLLRNENWLLLSDFGIARILSSEERHTRTGVGFGTPDYMAPEQAQGRAVLASDNYSLAVIAYQLLTGRLPFNADTGYAVTIQHMTQEPPPPSQFNPSLSPTCEALLLRGLAKRPEERFPSAEAFVSALQRTLSTPAYTIYPPGMSIHPQPAVSSAAPMMQPIDAANAATRLVPAEGAQLPVTNSPQEASLSPVTRRRFLLGGGAAVVLAGGGIAAWALLNSTSTGHPRSAASGQTATPSPPASDPNAPAIKILRQHINPANVLAWAVGKNVLASLGDQDTLFLWDVEQLQQQPDAPTPLAKRAFNRGSTMRLAWSPDGSKLAVGNTGEGQIASLRETIDVYTSDLSTKAPGITNPLTTGTTFQLSGLGWIQKSALVAVSSRAGLNDDNHFDLWAVDTSRAQQTLQATTVPGHLGGPLNSSPSLLAISPDGMTVAVALIDNISIGQIQLSGKTPRWQPVITGLTFNENFYQPYAVAWFSNRDIIGSYYTGIASSTIALWSLKSRSQKPMQEVTADAQLTIMASCPASTSSLLAAGTQDGRVLVWNMQKNTDPVGILNSGGISGEVLALAWSNDGQWLAASYKDNDASVVIWKIRGRGF